MVKILPSFETMPLSAGCMTSALLQVTAMNEVLQRTQKQVQGSFLLGVYILVGNGNDIVDTVVISLQSCPSKNLTLMDRL